MLTDTAPSPNDYDDAPAIEPLEYAKLTADSPEFRRIFESAGAALMDGDFATAQALTNEMFARDEDIPAEAVRPMEIRSAEPYRLRTGGIPQELHYWLEHPSNRQQHRMEVSSDDDGNLHALWTGPDQEGLKLGMAHYVLGECTDEAGEINLDKLEEIMSSIYVGDFSNIPGIASYRLGEHEAELIFSPNEEDELFGEKISEMAAAVSREKRWGEVGFTFSVDEDETGTSGQLDDMHVFSVSTNGHIDLEEAPKPMSSVGHTHPIAVPFSGSDIRMIMKYPNIPHMVIIQQ